MVFPDYDLFVQTILLISPYWKEEHRWMVSSYKLAELWQRIGFRVVVACMGSSDRIEEMSPTLTVHYRKDIFLPDPWNYGICFGFAGYVKRLADSLKPDQIVVNKVLFWTSFSLLRLRLAGYKVTLLTDALVGMTWWPRGFIPRIAAAIYAWTAGWQILCSASRIVFFHPQPQRLLSFLCIRGKTRVIPTGIDESVFLAPDRDPEKVTVTYIGRLESVKGVDDFLAAAVPLKESHQDLRIQVVGWYKPGHPLVSQYQGDVEFLGLRDDIPAILAKSDIFVLPSYSEGLSNALMEAMSASCACIASDVGGNRYLLADQAGLLFPAGDRQALEVALASLLDDPVKRGTLQHAARERIQKHFSWTAVSRQYQSLFQS